jgi:hypothetical protein
MKQLTLLDIATGERQSLPNPAKAPAQDPYAADDELQFISRYWQKYSKHPSQQAKWNWEYDKQMRDKAAIKARE